jgi:hypothetical protein
MVFITTIVICKYLYFGTGFWAPCGATQTHTVVPFRLGDHRSPVTDHRSQEAKANVNRLYHLDPRLID